MTEDGFASTLVPVDKIKPPLFQCRTETLDVDLDELAESIKTVGLLEPLVIRYNKDKEVELVVGSRRLKACQKAGLTVVPVVVRDLTDEQALEIEGCENLNRNDLSPEEKTRLCVEWAKLGYKPTEIPVKVHKSYSWVVTFLPDKYKDKEKSEAGKLGGEAKAATTIVAQPKRPNGKLDVSDLASCENCGMATHIIRLKTLNVNGEDMDLCPLCYDHFVKVPKAPTKSPAQASAVKDSWEHRAAAMKVQHSKQESDLLQELVLLGVEPEIDVPVPLWQTVPDGVYRERKLCYYVHGAPHDKGKALDRDDQIEAALLKLGWKVLVFRHGEGSVKEWALQVKEALKF